MLELFEILVARAVKEFFVGTESKNQDEIKT